MKANLKNMFRTSLMFAIVMLSTAIAHAQKENANSSTYSFAIVGNRVLGYVSSGSPEKIFVSDCSGRMGCVSGYNVTFADKGQQVAIPSNLAFVARPLVVNRGSTLMMYFDSCAKNGGGSTCGIYTATSGSNDGRQWSAPVFLRAGTTLQLDERGNMAHGR